MYKHDPQITARLEAADVLDRAAEYIDDYGWCQGNLGHYGGPRCALGAMEAFAMRDSERWDVALAALAAAAGVRPLGVSIALWNDYRARQEDVTAAMRTAAAALRSP